MAEIAPDSCSSFPSPSETGKAYDRIAAWFRSETRNSPCGMPFLEELLSLLPEHAHVLDAGCGFGRMTRILLNRGFRVTGVDVSGEMLRLASEYVPEAHLALADAVEFRTDETFDAILAWDSLFHLPPDRHRPMLKHMGQLLKPDGIFLMTSGSRKGRVSGMMHGVEFHYSTLSMEEYRTELVRSGFFILRMIQDQLPEEHLVTFAQKKGI